jgi:His/Glu/Gln/Arg/opine family amino acid ABC transporter permease subunit
MSTTTRRPPPQMEALDSPEDRRLAGFATLTLVVGGVAAALILLGIPIVLVLNGVTPYEQLVEGFTSSTSRGLVIIGAGVGGLALLAGLTRYRRMPTKRSRERAIAGGVLGVQAVAFGLLVLAFQTLGDPAPFFRSFLNFEVLEGYGFTTFLRSAGNTVILAFAGEAGGIVLGLLFAVLLLSHRPVVRAPARAYVNFFRGTPLIWQLSVFYFGFSFGLGIQFSAFTAAIIVFILNTGAYAAEVFRAGIQSIERGQLEAARSLGLSYPQALRYAIIPQAIRRVIPPLMNEFVILIKDTSLVVVLGLLAEQYELYTWAREGYTDTFNATFFVAAAAGYLAITLPLIRAVNAVEKRLRSGLVGVTAQ